MGTPVRIRLSRQRGWRMPDNTVKVDRTTRWGNPFNMKDSAHCWTALSVGCKGDPAGRHEASVKLFRSWIEGGAAVRYEECGIYVDAAGQREAVAVSPHLVAPLPPTLEEIRSAMAGKNLACWCKLDQPCHADVLLELANRTPIARKETDNDD